MLHRSGALTMKWSFFPDESGVPIFRLGRASDLLGKRSTPRWKLKCGFKSGTVVDGMGASGSSTGLSPVAEVFCPIVKCGENSKKLSIRIGERCGNQRNKARIKFLFSKVVSSTHSLSVFPF